MLSQFNPRLVTSRLFIVQLSSSGTSPCSQAIEATPHHILQVPIASLLELSISHLLPQPSQAEPKNPIEQPQAEPRYKIRALRTIHA